MTKVLSLIFGSALLPVLVSTPAYSDALALQTVELEWIEDFESYSPGPLTDSSTTWSVTGDGLANVAAGAGVGSTQGLNLATTAQQDLALRQGFQSGFEPVVWIDFTAELAPFADDADFPTLDTESSVAVQLTQSGAVRVIDGSTWQTLDLELPVDEPHRYSLRKDYLERTWQLWIDGVLRTPNPLSFYSLSTRELPGLLRIEQEGANESSFDNISVSTAAPPGLDNVGNWSTWHDTVNNAAGWAGDSSPGGDPNNNRLLNLEEYAFGFTDPVGGPHFYQPALTREEDGDLVLTYRKYRDAEDVRYVIESSCTLDDWVTVEVEPGKLVPREVGDGVDEITVTIPATESCKYVRVKTVLRQ